MPKWLSENPAKLIGMQKNRRKIEAGYDADLVIWDDEKEFSVTGEIIQQRHKITPYLNRTLSGTVEQTYLRGLKVFENGSFTALNTGKILKMGV